MLTSRLLPTLLLCLVLAPPCSAAVFPLEQGELVASCYADPDGVQPSRYVVGIVDARDPGCDPTAQPGQNWTPPMYHNEMPNPTGNPADEWTRDNLGQVFGIALDDAQPPNIYVTSSSVYLPSAAQLATGRVFRLDGTTGGISVLATLPNQVFNGDLRPGLGNLAFDRQHQQLFVSNMEDGKIYRISLTGAIEESFDPFAPDDGTPGFAPRGERLWAVGVNECRVYFSVWAEDCGTPSTSSANTIWSVGLDPDDGSFLPGTETLEITPPEIVFDNGVPASNPVADIEFSDDGRMLLGERTMIGDTRTNAHQSRVLEYSGGHLQWFPSGAEFDIGVDGLVFACGEGSGTNAAGGVDYECGPASDCDGSGKIWVTGDALQIAPGALVYGLQGTSRSGGGPDESFLIDLDGDVVRDAKTLLGDVDVYRTCVSNDLCSPFDDGEARCVGCQVCNDPGLCEADIPCDGSVAVCATSDGFESPSCDPAGPYPVGTSFLSVRCGSDEIECDVAVRDCEPPGCSAPPELRIECSGSCGSPVEDPDIQEWLSRAEAFDNCGVVDFHSAPPEVLSAGCQQGSVTEITFTAVDREGLEGACRGRIVVEDTTPPDLSVPAPKTLECEGPGGLPAFRPEVRAWLEQASADDLCGSATLTDDAPALFPSGCAPGVRTPVEFTATDSCGNADSGTSWLAVQDTLPPSLRVPADLTLDCDGPGGIPDTDARIQAWLGSASAADACGPAALVDDAPSLFPAGCGSGATTVVRFTAGDECGNAVTETASVTVVDRTPPELHVPEPLVLECDGPGGIPAQDPRIRVWLEAAWARDDCGSTRVVNDAPALFPSGCAPGETTIVTFTATDACGLSVSASSTVTVQDTTPPVAEACGPELCLWPPNHKYYCFEEASALVRVSDACGGAEIIGIDCVSSQCDDAPCPDHPGENGDGATTEDCVWDPVTDRLCVRAERAGTDPNGRLYSVTFLSADECGLLGADVGLTIRVPHDLSPWESCLSPPPSSARP